MNKKDVVEWLKKNADQLGEEWTVKRNVKTTKKTFEVDEDVLKELYEQVHKRGLKMKEAIDQALRAWIDKK